MAVKFECSDFLLFQESLKKMREMDDKIIYALNTTIPTESFKGQVSAAETCGNLYGQLSEAHQQRRDCITKCIRVTADNVKIFKSKRDEDFGDVDLHKKFKSEQRKLRMLQSELNVEDIVKERTYKTFNERCRLFFTPQNPL